MDIGISIIITFVLISLNGYFSLAESALGNARRFMLQSDVEEGDRRAARAEKLAEENGRFLSTIRATKTLLGVCAAVVATLNLTTPLSNWLKSFEIAWLGESASVLAPIIIVAVVVFVCIVLGDLLPKRIALANAENISKSVSGTMSIYRTLASPFVAITSGTAHALARLFRVKDVEDRSYSEEEIMDLVTDNEELLDDEKRMIHEIINLGDTTVREIMQPRADVIFAEDTETVRQILDRMRGTGYSRLPVFHNDYDNIVGFVHFKDLINPMIDGKEDDLAINYAFEAYFVPEMKEIFPLLSEMQTNRQQIAIVVDEYGGTDGLITIEDIVEEIVGEIIDETDLEAKFITPVSETEWLVDGRFPCEEAEEMGWPVVETDDYETIAGWLMDMIDVVPQLNDEYVIDGYEFKVLQMRRRRIWAIRVKKISETVAEKEDRSDDES